ncbi:hypothetical protein COY27_01900 [Candidatus Woesearchaeota archaeon CG_4_10_14_0_2_um_filter_33_13]|nr:MAG: hypothetical protein COY27_01900 [Candidatus Woesearchaeota archaeon CG_4_10_14_0_2_um_filter_33_13]
MVDTVGPAVSVSIPAASTWYNANFTVTVNATDSLTGVNNSSVQYRILNSTGSNVTGWTNLTLSSGLYTATFDILSQDEVGDYTFEFNATDLLGNSNSTVNVTSVGIDLTNPAINSLSVGSVTTTGGILTVNATDALSGVSNCTYTGAGSGSLTNVSDTYTATLSGLTASTVYTVNVTCIDTVGNVQSNLTSSFTTSAAATTGSSGGSGGSASSSVSGQFAKNVWNVIKAGETKTVTAANGEMGVTDVQFGLTKEMWGIWLKFEKKDSLPSNVKTLGKEVYKFVEVSKSITIKDSYITNAKVDFKVLKSWLSDKKLGKDNIALFRYVDGQWVALATTMGEDDGTYVHYSASTPGFSYFAIAQKELAEPVVAETAAPVTEQPTAEQLAAETGEVVAEPVVTSEEAVVQRSKTGIIVLVVVVLLVIAGLVWWFIKKGH